MPESDDFEGWMGKGVDLWCLGDVVMNADGQVTEMIYDPRSEQFCSVIRWAPTSGMLRARLRPQGEDS